MRSVRISIQVISYSKRLAPEPRRAVKGALEDLRSEKGDFRALQGNLAGYYRLRVGSHRIIFCYEPEGAIEVIFIEERALVYELFESQFIKRLQS